MENAHRFCVFSVCSPNSATTGAGSEPAAAAPALSGSKPEQLAEGPPARGSAAHEAGLPAASAAQAGPPYMVMGSKKGGFPVSTEARAKGKKVTVVHRFLSIQTHWMCR